MICRRPQCTPGCLRPVDPAHRRSPVAQLGVALRAAWSVALSVGLLRLAALGPRRSAARRASWVLTRRSRAVLRALGITVETTGAPRRDPALVVGNHQSFLDILVLAAQRPMRQVAKVEVAGWPLFGGLARTTGSLFLDRRALHELPALVEAAGAALRSGDTVQVFPEATTRCGDAITEFHRAVLQAAVDAAVAVTPVTLRYAIAGEPVNAPAFLGDETLLDVLRRILALRGLTVQVRWLPAVPAIAGTGHRATDRARLTTLVQDAVARDLAVPVVWRTGRRVELAPATDALRAATDALRAAPATG